MRPFFKLFSILCLTILAGTLFAQTPQPPTTQKTTQLAPGVRVVGPNIVANSADGSVQINVKDQAMTYIYGDGGWDARSCKVSGAIWKDSLIVFDSTLIVMAEAALPNSRPGDPKTLTQTFINLRTGHFVAPHTYSLPVVLISGGTPVGDILAGVSGAITTSPKQVKGKYKAVDILIDLEKSLVTVTSNEFKDAKPSMFVASKVSRLGDGWSAILTDGTRVDLRAKELQFTGRDGDIKVFPL